MKELKYSLGLDIGVTSVGWAVIDLKKERIHDLGVRIFEVAETPKEGKSLAEPRRIARGARRRLRRRRQRLNNLKRFFIDQNILAEKQIDNILNPKSDYNKLDVYELRAKALKEELTAEELFKVFYQIAKRRGFKSNRKTEEKADKNEGGKVLSATSANSSLIGEKYQTAGEALFKDDKFKVRKRNKNDYINSFNRDNFIDEVKEIINFQKKYTLKGIDQKVIDMAFYGGELDGDRNVKKVTNKSAVFYQRPFMTTDLIENMVGDCAFEKGKKRAPKASCTFEVFRLASDLNNLVYVPKPQNSGRGLTTEIRLNPNQIKKVIDEAKKTKSLTYKKVQKVAEISDEYCAKYVRGKKKKDDEFGDKNYFGGLPAYHAIKSALKDLPEDWETVNNEKNLNEIAYILTTERADEEILQKLKSLPLSDDGQKAIVAINVTTIKDSRSLSKKRPAIFRSFGYLSIEAMQKITPSLLKGMTYDEACKEAGYDFRKKENSLEQITNPVVKRAIIQTTKVVEAIEKKYGAPYFVKVETARELAKNRDDRNQIKQEQEENQAGNEDIKNIILLGYDYSPKSKKGEQLLSFLKENNVPLTKNPDFNGQQIIKVKLYREQNGKCLYSGESIDFETMLRDDNAYQIDHILPLSRSCDNRFTNKVLVKTEENQRKGNRTPFEYFGGDEQRWKEFVARVEATYVNNLKKKQNLLVEKYERDGWSERALTNTQYITRFIYNYLQEIVTPAPGDDKKRFFAYNGTITSYIRKRWGLGKDREEDVLHHAKDAAIAAVIDDKLIRQVNEYSKNKELKPYLRAKKAEEKYRQELENITDKETGEINEDGLNKINNNNLVKVKTVINKHENKYDFPQPWGRSDFDKEVRKRTMNTDKETLQNKLCGLENYDDEFRLQVEPVFVSRMAKRKTTGKAHEETLYSRDTKDNNRRSKRVNIKSIRLIDLENTLLDKNDVLINQVSKIIKNSEKYKQEASEKKRKEIKLGDVFAGDIYKANKRFDKNSKPIAPVSSIKVYSTQPSGFYINNNKAFVNNGDTICLNIYKHKLGYFAAPVYVHLKNEKHFPIKPTPSGRTKPEKELWNSLRSEAGEILSTPENGFTKVCSIFPNDYVKIKNKDSETKEGYYVKFGSGENTGRGNLVLIPHFVADKGDKNHINVGVGTIDKIQKVKISVLGDNASER